MLLYASTLLHIHRDMLHFLLGYIYLNAVATSYFLGVFIKSIQSGLWPEKALYSSRPLVQCSTFWETQ